MPKKLWAYLCKHRPPAPGAVPKEGLEETISYGTPQYFEVADGTMRSGWGTVMYNHRLPPKEAREYELYELKDSPVIIGEVKE